MDHCLSFTGGFGDLPYLSTIPFHLQLLNLQFSYKYIYLSWKYSRTKFKNILGNEWDGLISGLIAVASILLCFPENPTGFSANPLLFAAQILLQCNRISVTRRRTSRISVICQLLLGNILSACRKYPKMSFLIVPSFCPFSGEPSALRAAVFNLQKCWTQKVGREFERKLLTPNCFRS